MIRDDLGGVGFKYTVRGFGNFIFYLIQEEVRVLEEKQEIGFY